MSNVNTDRALGWNDEIQNDGDYSHIPDGEYNFKILKFERSRHDGHGKLPACNKAILNVEVYDDDGRTLGKLNHNLFLHSKTEGLLCQFFRSIGARKSGERLVMDWNKVPGSQGRLIIKNNEMPSSKDPSKKVTFCNVDRFLDPQEATPGGNADDQAF